MNKSKNDYKIIDEVWASKNLPARPKYSNKGSFGKALIIAGSDKYRGAAHLAVASSLRGGAGYTVFYGTEELCREIRAVYPEAIYIESARSPVEIARLSDLYSATLIGPGCDVTSELFSIVSSLVESDGTPLIIDADAINSVAKYSSPEIFKSAKRKIILTPHPLEFSRLSGISTEDIAADRVGCAVEFARKYGVILLLKGYQTVITDGDRVFVNGSGSAALAKAGSGDVLAGLLTSLMAFSSDPVVTAALAAYIHGKAADMLEDELSSFGVTPSDLPIEFSRVIASLEKHK